jgi:uncharacterized protein (TIGR02421 family)
MVERARQLPRRAVDEQAPGDSLQRRDLADGGRLHLDRPLPFLVVAAHAGEPVNLARQLARISASSLLWKTSSEGQHDAASALHEALQALRGRFPQVLLVSLYDLPPDAALDDTSPRLERLEFVLGASDDAPAQAAAAALAQALQDLEIEQRKARVAPVDAVDAGPAAPLLAGLADGVSRLTLGLPPVYRVPGGDGVYPQVFRSMESAVFDALLRACAAFMQASTPGPAFHHRLLGRSHMIQAVRDVDAALEAISRSFEFLLAVSPINTVEERDRYLAGNQPTLPEFRYRPLTISPETSKRALFAIDVRSVEDPVLETIFLEKQREIDLQLTLLQARNSADFPHASVMLYGAVDAPLLALAHDILAGIAPDEDGEDPCIDCHAVQAAAETMLARYRADDPGFQAEVCLRKDIAPGLMVSGRSVLISTATRMRRRRLDALLQHEIGVHVLTFSNGGRQGLSIFGTGLAGYEGIQEGLGVFAEYLAGGLTAARLRLLAARVLAVDAMLSGADFVACERLLRREHGFAPATAFGIVARVFRSGGLSKDAIYLRGLYEVFRTVQAGEPLEPFWFGKIAARHVPCVDDLLRRGLLSAPRSRPEVLSRPQAQARLETIRGGIPFIEALRGDAT